MLLAGGNFIGTNLNQRVFAALICEVAAPVERSTNKGGVALEPNGDFRIDMRLARCPRTAPTLCC